MAPRQCPTCKNPAPWEGNRSRPFCSERCRIQDLGAWSTESFRIPLNPAEGGDEAWSEEVPGNP